MRKLFIIVGATVFVVTAGMALYFFTRGSAGLRQPAAPSRGTPSPRARAQLRAAQKIVALSKTKVLPALSARRDGSVRFYTAEGAWEVPAGAETSRAISEVNLAGLTSVVWSADGQRVVTVREDTNGRLVAFYDYATAKGRALAPALQNVVFSPDGGRLGFQEKNNERGINQIVTSAVSGENAAIALKTRVGLWRLFWPDTTNLFAVSQPSGLAQGTAFRINPDDGSLTKMLSANGLAVNPSPTGKKLLYSRTDADGKNLTLSVLDTASANQRDLSQEFGLTTLAEKCAWSLDDRTLLCAAFRPSPPADAVMPDDYYKGVVSQAETLIAINLDTSEKHEIALPQAYDITAPALDATDNWFFFINRADGLLYGVELPLFE